MWGTTLTLVTITNPNPKTLQVWRNNVLQDSLKPHDQLKTPLTEGLMLTYEGRALAVLQIDGDDITDQEWVQQVGRVAVQVDPNLAYEKDRHA